MEFDNWEYRLNNAKDQNEVKKILDELLKLIDKDIDNQPLQYLYSVWAEKNSGVELPLKDNQQPTNEPLVWRLGFIEKLINQAHANMKGIKSQDEVLKHAYVSYYELLSVKHILHNDPMVMNRYMSKYHPTFDNELETLGKIIMNYKNKF